MHVEFRPAKADIFCNAHDGSTNLNGRNVSARRRAPWRIQSDATGNTRTGGDPCSRNYLTASQRSDAETASRGFLVERLGLDSAMALAAKENTSPSIAQRFSTFWAVMALFLFGVQVSRESFCRSLLQAVARPGVREPCGRSMTEIVSAGSFARIPRLQRQPADRRAVSACLDHVHHARVPWARKSPG